VRGTHLPLWSEKLNIPLNEVQVNVQGNLDIRGVLGLEEGVRAGFRDVAVAVRISGPEPAERYEKLRSAVDQHSAVLDIFANQGCRCRWRIPSRDDSGDWHIGIGMQWRPIERRSTRSRCPIRLTRHG